MNRPNLLFVFPDEFRPTSMGFLGLEKVKTPNLDKFAGESLTLTKAVSNFPVCSPYRAMLFSGNYPYKNGLITNSRSTTGPGVEWKDEEIYLSDILAREGFELGYIGKLHLRTPHEEDALHGEGPRKDGVVWDAYSPPGKARHSFNFWHSYGCCDNHNDPHYWTGNDPIEKKVEPRRWSVIHETDVAIDYLKNSDNQRDRDKPFALFLAHNPPHMPFNQVPGEYADIYAQDSPEDLLTWDNLTKKGRELATPHIKNYYGMISGVDEQFGRLLKTLDDEGLKDNTIVIFTSDHGEMMGSHGKMGKSLWYNESVHVPFIIRWPGKIKGGTRSELLLSAVDLMPTLLDLLGSSKAMPNDREGTNLAAQLLGQSNDFPPSAFYILPPQDTRGIITDRFTLVGELKEQEITWLCYDNLNDPQQLSNIYGEQPDRDNRFKKMLNNWLEKTNDPLTEWFRES